MDKEKEIQEMTDIMGVWASKAVIENHFDGASIYNPYIAKDLAETLFRAGFRKADEARKETALEILQDFYDRTFEMKDPYNGDIDKQKEVIDRGDILDMQKHYKVVIDE